MLYTAEGRQTDAVTYQIRADAVRERNLSLNLTAGSERQKLAYLATLTAASDQTISLHLRLAPNDPAAARLAMTIILQRKGRGLDATVDTFASSRRRASPR